MIKFQAHRYHMAEFSRTSSDKVRVDWIWSDHPGDPIPYRGFFSGDLKRLMANVRAYTGGCAIVVSLRNNRIIVQSGDCFQLVVNHYAELQQKGVV